MFLFDAHVHTAESSKCAKWSGAQAAEAYKQKGYSGIIVTDHFINGNTRADRTASWEEQIAVQMAGYKVAKARGDEIGLKVFFGFEAACDGAEFLTYGLDEEWLLKHPESAKLSMKEYLTLVRAEGAFVVHAHPFRRGRSMKCMHLIPDGVDAVEIVNFGNQEPDNRMARFYADTYGLPMTAGSDAHAVKDVEEFVVGTDTPIESVEDYIERIKQGRLILPSAELKA
jgi:histidinol phosphatase-like PHP family hydrolase